MSARYPTTVRMSLEEFSRHGGLSGPHKDGWGLAWYDERDVRLVKEALPASDSPTVRFLKDNPFCSPLVMSHVRKATHGQVALRNCQPMMRELGGTWHTFAHNGDLAGIADITPGQDRTFLPVGETDSERAFCMLLERLRPLWQAPLLPLLSARLEVLAAFASEMRQMGPANFLYCDGDALFAHADRRHQSDGSVRAPGLWQLARQCPGGGELDSTGLHIASQALGQEVVLVASVPLTSEDWVPLKEGEIIVVRQGRLDDGPGSPVTPAAG